MAQQMLASDPSAAYIRENLLPLRQLGCLSLITSDVVLADGIRALHTPGHTPGHLSVEIRADSGAGLLLLGDAVSHPLQITTPNHTYTLEVDAQTACETRLQLLERIKTENLIIAACHFPEPGFGRVIRQGQQRYWCQT
jgi:glyoxylase-like metal-dependent hydrolase (beta-lactamase superfamily II)